MSTSTFNTLAIALENDCLHCHCNIECHICSVHALVPVEGPSPLLSPGLVLLTWTRLSQLLDRASCRCSPISTALCFAFAMVRFSGLHVRREVSWSVPTYGQATCWCQHQQLTGKYILYNKGGGALRTLCAYLGRTSKYRRTLAIEESIVLKRTCRRCKTIMAIYEPIYQSLLAQQTSWRWVHDMDNAIRSRCILLNNELWRYRDELSLSFKGAFNLSAEFLLVWWCREKRRRLLPSCPRRCCRWEPAVSKLRGEWLGP